MEWPRTIAGIIISLLVNAYVIRKLITNFRPDYQKNNWPRALLCAFAMSIASALVLVLLPAKNFPIRLLAAFMIGGLPFVAIYRISIALGAGLALLTSLLSLAMGLGAGLAYGALWALHPVAAVVGILVVIVVPLLLHLRDRRQRQLMNEIYRDGKSS